MNTEEIIKALRDMAKYPTVTLPRDREALKAAADLLAQPEQEPERLAELGWQQIECSLCGTGARAFFPPQRTWVGLTAEERLDIWTNTATPMLIAATEAKLKDKNDG